MQFSSTFILKNIVFTLKMIEKPDAVLSNVSLRTVFVLHVLCGNLMVAGSVDAH